MKKLILFRLSLIAGLFAGMLNAYATVVLNTTDSGAGSLRQAIIDTPAGGSITFTNTLDGASIPLLSQILIGKDLAIDASALANGIILDGTSTPRIFSLSGATTNTFENLTFSNAYVNVSSGGGMLINAGATVTINQSTFTQCKAIFSGGAIHIVTGQVTINDSTFSGNIAEGNSSAQGGGAINMEGGTLTINRCTLAGNHADIGAGGGILVKPTATLIVNHSTLTGNESLYGGGIFNNGALTINNSTLTQNSATTDAGGAIYTRIGSLTVNNGTITENTALNTGGGIYRDSGTATVLNNSIVAQNTATNGSLPVQNTTNITPGPNNITSGDPLLAPLGNYGGPTQTMPPLIGSPAIDAGLTSATNSLTDQRGAARIAGAAVDIGAVEVQPSTVVLNTNDSGPGSLREIINYTAPDATITFTNILSDGTITLTSGHILVDRGLTIDASALSGGITIDGNTNNSLFEFTVGTNVLNGLTLTQGRGSALAGGAVFLHSNANLIINRSTLSDSYSHIDGGSIYNDGGVLTINNSTLSGNETRGDGGSIYNGGGALTINNSTLTENKSRGHGAGIRNVAGTLTINNSIIALNKRTFSSGDNNIHGSFSSTNSLTSGDPILAPLGHYGGPTQTMPPLYGSPAIDAGSNALTNTVTDQRGAVREAGIAVDIGAVESQSIVLNTNDSGDGSFRNAISYSAHEDTITFTNDLSGQIIVLTSGQILIDQNLSIDASALSNGITINGNGTITSNRIFEISAFTTNSIMGLSLTNGLESGGSGGAIRLNPGSHLTLSDSKLLNNSARLGGGIFNFGTLILNNSALSGNTATYAGGGIYNETRLTLNHSTLSDNSALNRGGGIHSDKVGTNSLNNSTLSGNSSQRGGAIYLTTSSVTLNNSTLADNDATIEAGGIYISGGGTHTLYNSIVANNSASTNANINRTFLGTNNLTSGNPMLATLDYYGGPTQTMPPLIGSPAIDAGLPSATNSLTDQRGLARVQSGGFGPAVVDIGAVEWNGWLVGQNVSSIDPSFLLPGSVYDSASVFPGGFDPTSGGMLRIQTPAEMDALVAQGVVEGENNVTNNPNAYGLYTPSEVLDLGVGDIGVQITNGMAELNVQLWQTEDLITWTNIGDTVYWTEPVDADKKFFRVRAEP